MIFPKTWIKSETPPNTKEYLKGFKRTLIASLLKRPVEKAASKTSSKSSFGSFNSNMFSEQSTIK